MREPNVVTIVEGSVGVHGTAPTCYLSVLARFPGLAIAEFDDAISAATLVRARAMRQSFYAFPPDLLRIAVAATRGQSQRGKPLPAAIDASYGTWATRVEEVLENGPLPESQLRRLVDPEQEIRDSFAGLLGRMTADCRIVRTAAVGSWRSDGHAYARWADWVPGPNPINLDRDASMRQLAQRYVAGYGPVTIDDVRWWTGWSREETLAAVDGIDLTTNGSAAAMLDGLRLLPVWDPLISAYLNRDRLFDPVFSSLVYDRYGNSTSVVFDRGTVVGQWDLGESDDHLSVAVAPFRAWPESRWDEVEVEVGRIATLISAESHDVLRVEEPIDLLDSPRNRFLYPLSRRR